MQESDGAGCDGRADAKCFQVLGFRYRQRALRRDLENPVAVFVHHQPISDPEGHSGAAPRAPFSRDSRCVYGVGWPRNGKSRKGPYRLSIALRRGHLLVPVVFGHTPLRNKYLDVPKLPKKAAGPLLNLAKGSLAFKEQQPVSWEYAVRPSRADDGEGLRVTHLALGRAWRRTRAACLEPTASRYS